MSKWMAGFGLLLIMGYSAAVQPALGTVTQTAGLVAATMAATPAATPSTNPLVIWWPAPLYPDVKSAAADTFNAQLSQYQIDTGVAVTIRIKRDTGSGSIYDTLYNGSFVAPAALPDLTLMRRSDLLKAVAAKLIHPVELDKPTVDDLFAAGLTLGEVQGTQYGTPYMLETQHLAYRAGMLPQPPRTLDAMLKNGQAYLFPGAADKGVNPTFLAQYVSAGGHILDQNGAPTLDQDALATLLGYYEQAVKAGLVGPKLLDYSSPGQYWSSFTAGKINVVQVDSTTFLTQLAGSDPTSTASNSNGAGANLGAVNTGPLPALGQPSSALVDGWLWVITTNNPDRQAKAVALIKWFLDTDRQGQFGIAISYLPSRRSALKTWQRDPYAAYAALVEPLLEDTVTPLPDAVRPSVASALQTAFEDVLNGRKSADAAASAAIAQVGKVR